MSLVSRDTLHVYLKQEVPTESLLFNYYLNFWEDQTDPRKLYFHKDILIEELGLKNKTEQMIFILAMIQVTADPIHESRSGGLTWEETIGIIDHRVPRVDGEYYYRFLDFDFKTIRESKEIEESFRLFLELINAQIHADILKKFNIPPVADEELERSESEIIRNSILIDERSHQYCWETLRSRVEAEFAK